VPLYYYPSPPQGWPVGASYRALSRSHREGGPGTVYRRLRYGLPPEGTPGPPRQRRTVQRGWEGRLTPAPQSSPPSYPPFLLPRLFLGRAEPLTIQRSACKAVAAGAAPPPQQGVTAAPHGPFCQAGCAVRSSARLHPPHAPAHSRRQSLRRPFPRHEHAGAATAAVGS